MGQIKIIDGDLLKAEEKCIAHQVNCLGLDKSGVADQIRRKWESASDSYREHCKNRTPKQLLGTNWYVETDDGKVIVNMFGQNTCGWKGRHTDYESLFSCLEDLINTAESDVALPYMFGCYRGGGDWGIVYPKLEELVKAFKFDIILYRRLE